jgi:hypothetical protein
MAPFTLLTARDAKRFHELANRMPRAEGLEFLEHDGAVAQFWPRLNASFPENQFCLIDEGTGIAAGIGKSITLAFDGTWADLPTEGLDWAVEKGFADRAAGRTPNLMSALYIEIAETHRGQHLSAQMLAAMREIARSQGFQTLIAPVRPSLKSRYLLIDIQTYLACVASLSTRNGGQRDSRSMGGVDRDGGPRRWRLYHSIRAGSGARAGGPGGIHRTGSLGAA